MGEKMSKGELMKGYALLFFAGVGMYTVGKDVADMISRYRAAKKIERCTELLNEMAENIVKNRKDEEETE